MKKRSLTLIGMMVSCLLLTACEQEDLRVKDEQIVGCIAKNQVDFSKFFLADWDTIYIFHPYTPLDFIEETIGTRVKFETAIEYSDAVNLVIAMKEETVVNYSEISRMLVDFKATDLIQITIENPYLTIHP